MTSLPSIPPPAAAWIVDLVIGFVVVLPSGESIDRDGFYDWLWGEWGDDGLAGVFEGAVDASEAVTLGFEPTARVLDAAVAPAERDWVARLPQTTAAAWFTDEPAARAAAAGLAAVAGCMVQGVREAPPAVHDDSWRAGFGPIDVPGFGVIRPAWDEGHAAASAAGATIYIEPGIGFGTGLHETTQLCLAALMRWRQGGGPLDCVLDFGSGSGILGIAAAVLGAGQVDSVEIDGWAHEAIRANASRNGVAECIRVAGQLSETAAGYDLVYANIVAAVLVAEAEAICWLVRRDANGGLAGCVVLSGLLAEEWPQVAECYTRLLDLRPVMTSMGDWHCLQFTPSPEAGRPCH
ncbi:MAG: 50S ribosomal protein L11 methyltransferase [Planctomycetia bacterium]|nr:50S ribosomal protein L11 methyltransferase [Planctomycetia bacterium]